MIQVFNHLPQHHDKEAYTEATAPSPSGCHQLTTFYSTCWGSQFVIAVDEDTPLEVFKFCSLSDFLTCRSDGPIAWKSIRQNQTALSSCKADIIATN